MSSEATQHYLSQAQREDMGLLYIGTFLEYFDLMLYAHSAILFNELFFPTTDPFATSLLSAFAFCSTYFFRPIGALIFGYIGDNISRRTPIILTAILMSVSCIIIAILPTYAQIGIASSWIFVLCRMIQGAAATAEIRGAELYLTEVIRSPKQYPIIASLGLFGSLGSTLALAMAWIYTSTPDTFQNSESNWRLGFFVGSMVGVVATIGRTSLRESAEFIYARYKANKRKAGKKASDIDPNEISGCLGMSSICYFFIQCAGPCSFYFIYIYSADILKNEFAFSLNEIIAQNFWVSILGLWAIGIVAYLSSKIHPYKILKYKFYFFFLTILLFPMAMNHIHTPRMLFIFQVLAVSFIFDHVPASPLFYKYFPILKRFTYTSMLSALSTLLAYVVTSFGFLYATTSFGYAGVLFIFIPVGICFYLSLLYFERFDVTCSQR